jgi:Periplasmic copper-binding protein (NosD)/FlgD Ig-like domain
MRIKKSHLCFVTAILLVTFGAVQAQFPVTVTDQTPTAPLANPTPSTYQPRYISGFGIDNTFTVFFEDRDAANQISFVSTTSGPAGFPTAVTGTNITDTHFLIKDWPITISSISYAYRAWGSVGNNLDHHFYVSNDLTTWTLVSTFTIPNAASFTDAHGFVYYGFHDVIQLNGTYYAFAESNQSQTMLVRSANGDDVWEAFASVGGRPGWGPLELPSGVSTGWTPSGSFVDLGYDRGYGKVHVDPRDNNFYLAINQAAKASLAPAALEAAFINPANWTWHDGTTGPASNPILSATAEHDLRECWVVPNSAPGADWVIIYDADFGAADGGKALGYATLTPPAPPRVHNITQGTHYVTITAAISAANPGDVILVDAGTFNERVTITKSLDIRGAQYGVDPTATGARTNPAAESIIDLTSLSVTNPNVLVEIPNGVTNVSLSGFTLIGSPTLHYADEAVVRCWDDNITIQDNIIDGYFAVLLKGADNLTVHRNRMITNKVGVTVQPNPANNVTISDNLIMRGSSPAADAAGIYMTGCSNSHITGNTANGFVGGSGANGSNLNHLTVSGNTFTGNKDAISFFGGTTFVTIENNDLSNSSRFGINIKGQDIDIVGNTITNCGDAGINIDRHVIDTERIRLTCNDISGNTNYGVKVNTASVTAIINAELNWWGDASGPYDPDGATEVPPCADTPDALNANGAGDAVTGNVDYCPWAINAQCQPLRLCGDFALLATVGIELDHYKFVEGDIHSNGGIEFDNGRPGMVSGNVTAIGNIEIARDNTINGDVTANGIVKKDKKATVNGTTTSGGSLAAVDLPSLSYSCTGADGSVKAGKDKQKNVAPGDYNVLSADKNAQLNFSAGEYSVTTLQLDDRSRLNVDVSGGDVIINVCGEINFIKNADIIIIGGDSKQLTVNYLGTKIVVLGKDGNYQGSFIAPNALVELGKNAGFLGSICAKCIAISKDARVRFHGLGAIPKPAVADDEEEVSSVQSPVTSYQLEQNYPNPFNPTTSISFALPEAGEVTLAIYNIYGQLVRQLVSGQVNAGRHSVIWDATNDHGQKVASGMYLYVIKAGAFTAQKKLVLMK